MCYSSRLFSALFKAREEDFTIRQEFKYAQELRHSFGKAGITFQLSAK